MIISATIVMIFNKLILVNNLKEKYQRHHIPSWPVLEIQTPASQDIALSWR